MNLWKLWIVQQLLPPRPPGAEGDPVRPDPGHASMDGMTDDVTQIEVGALPLTFDDSVVLLDVREPDEWQRGHVAGAQHIPLGDVPARIDEIDRDATLYVICHAGGRSQRVAQYLARNGFEPANVTGGMLAWAQAGRPVNTDDGSAGTV